jgi:hypothetical protein
MNKLFLLVSLCVAVLSVHAQETEQTVAADAVAPPAVEKKAPAASDEKSSDKKMVREANINLQTTVTGNQEQPRVMYILPWQSPLSPDLEMEMLSSQEDAVFGHIERDEMQRSLEAAGELDSADE